jgi:hypothetical protein
MAKLATKQLAWQRPRLEVPAASGFGADALWAQGVAAEEAYDFEAARDAFRQAAAAASQNAALDYVARYAEFLVERFGQFEEVAAWLDDANFAAPPETTGHALARLLARAAHEAKHPREAEIDERAAEGGDMTALLRAVDRQAASGALEAARLRLEAKSAQLPANGQRQLERLRQQVQEASLAALAPVETALAAGDVVAAAQHMRALQGGWGQTPAFHALQQRLSHAQRQATLAQLRADVHTALTEADVTAAERLATQLAAQPGATAEDRAILAQIRALLSERAIAAAWHEAAGQIDVVAQLAVLARLIDEHGPSPHAPAALAELWQMVRQAAQLPHALPLRGRVTALLAWRRLLLAESAGEIPQMAEALRGLPEAWNHAPQAQRARERIRQHEATAREAAEATVVAEVQAFLDVDDLAAAHVALDAAQKCLPQSPGLKALRAELSHLRHQVERRDKLRQAIQDAIGQDDVLTARARLAELVHFVDAAERQTLTEAIELRAAPLLKAKGMPPGLQKLQNAPLVTGAGLGRLVIVQETVWLTVNLETGGIAPFALPDGWPVQVHAWTRIGVVGERLRLVGISKQRLVVIEQVPGQPPAVVAGMPLPELLGDDDTLMGASLTPDAPTWVLLSRSSTRGTAPTWTRVDARTLAVLDRKKAQPKLEGLCGVDGQADLLLAVAAPKHRAEYALAAVDASGQTRMAFSEADVGEAIAAVREGVGWPAEERIYARFAGINPFSGEHTQEPSLLVIKNGRISFASTELRKRFAPQDKLAIDHAWTLDQHAGRLWFAAQSTQEGAENGAMLLGVNARTLRPDKPVAVAGVARILALHPVAEGAVALGRLAAGGYGLTRAVWQDGTLALTTRTLPL